MITKVLRAVLVAIAVTAIARGTVFAFGLDALVAEVLGRFLVEAQRHITSVVWLGSGFLGLVGLALWTLFRIDDKLADLFRPRPALGSLPFVDIGISVSRDLTAGRMRAELLAKLRNTNQSLVGMDGRLSGEINGQRYTAASGGAEMAFTGLAYADSPVSLILKMPELALGAVPSVRLHGYLRYDVAYFLQESPPPASTDCEDSAV